LEVQNPLAATRETIIQLLSSIGSRREVDEYLKRFASVDSTRFAVIRLSGAILRADLEGIVEALAFLERVGLVPVVLHGAGPQINEELARLGLEPRVVDGRRVVDAEVLGAMRRAIQAQTLRLVEALEAVGTRARPLLGGVFGAALRDGELLGFVGSSLTVHTAQIEAAVKARQIPILSCLGETATGQIVALLPDQATIALASALEPDKVVYLHEAGGLLDVSGAVVPSVNLLDGAVDADSPSELSPEGQGVLAELSELLRVLPASSSVSVTSPTHLARELFTHSGSGTLVRLGERIDCFSGQDGWSMDRVARLLESCFGRPLVPDYFETKPFYRVYVSESYRATAILTLEGGMVYLDKFGVTRKAQGEGLGRSVWLRMRRDNPRFFWRSRANNPINSWYFSQCDGCWRTAEWVVFWCGLSDWAEVKSAVELALSLPPTLVAHAVGEP
jgi:acetylglutamate kinase